jgi:hypothetical protein
VKVVAAVELGLLGAAVVLLLVVKLCPIWTSYAITPISSSCDS